MDTEQASASRPHQFSSPAASPSTLPRPPSNVPSSPAKDNTPYNRPSKSRRHSLPFPLPPLFFHPANSSSTSLVPSTAEGKPIPLDDDTAAHRTSALRELNSNYPSPVSRHRHRYAKSSGAQSSTYSQPVIVRTYSGPPPSQASYGAHSYHHRPPSVSRPGSRRIPLPLPSRAPSSVSGRPARGTISGIGSLGKGLSSAGGHGQAANMPRTQTKKTKLPWQWQLGSRYHEQDEAKLPPVEAFSFKSFLTDLQAQDSEAGGIGADLDRIAEICARSRYSLSNQYEVHVVPHGSGSTFLSSGNPSSSSGARKKGNGGHVHGTAGPTLQAITSDDDDSSVSGVGRGMHRRRRGGPGARRRSVAYGTLETIMSSSRSSEEEKSKKKSAAEIAEEVRGRAMRKQSDPPSTRSAESGSGGLNGGGSSRQAAQELASSSNNSGSSSRRRLARKKSASFATAVMDSTRSSGVGQGDVTAAAALLSEPALPQTSGSHLEIRTAPDDDTVPAEEGQDYDVASGHLAGAAATSVLACSQDGVGHVSAPGWSAWIPWRTSGSVGYGVSLPSQRGGGVSSSHAEGSLRQLLKTVEVKDKDKMATDEEDRSGKLPEGL